MKALKVLGIVLAAYVGIVLAFESMIGFEPTGPGPSSLAWAAKKDF